MNNKQKTLPLLAHIFAAGVVTGLLCLFYDWSADSDGLHYFAATWHRAPLIVGLALAGGVFTWVESRLSPRNQDVTLLVICAAVGLGVTAVGVWLLIHVIRARSFLVDSGELVWFALVFLIGMIVPAWCGYEFRRCWRRIQQAKVRDHVA